MFDRNWASSRPVGIGAKARPRVIAVQLSCLRPDGLAESKDILKAARTLIDICMAEYK